MTRPLGLIVRPNPTLLLLRRLLITRAQIFHLSNEIWRSEHSINCFLFLFSSTQGGKLFGQTASALAYIHATYRMCHRDIKLNNVLLDEKYNAKLTDFGFAKSSWNSSKHCVIMSDSFCGTPAYSCPQVLEKVVYNPFLADVFSMGVMLFAMLEGEFLFFGTVPEMVAKIKEYPAFVESRCRKFSSNASKLIVGMVDPSEDTRMTMHAVVEHKWVRKHKR